MRQKEYRSPNAARRLRWLETAYEQHIDAAAEDIERSSDITFEHRAHTNTVANGLEALLSPCLRCKEVGEAIEAGPPNWRAGVQQLSLEAASVECDGEDFLAILARSKPGQVLVLSSSAEEGLALRAIDPPPVIERRAPRIERATVDVG